MVELDEKKEENPISDAETEALREERRRTGRYVAAGTAVFLSLLGMYEAIRKGSKEFAAVFLTAVLMFGYITWLVYASKKRKYLRISLENIESGLIPSKEAGNDKPVNQEVAELTMSTHKKPVEVKPQKESEKEIDDFDRVVKELSVVNCRTFNRTYSVA